MIGSRMAPYNPCPNYDGTVTGVNKACPPAGIAFSSTTALSNALTVAKGKALAGASASKWTASIVTTAGASSTCVMCI